MMWPFGARIFDLLARLWRGRMPAAACNQAETKPGVKKTAHRMAAVFIKLL